MAIIQAKKPKIVNKGDGYVYIPAEFAKHKLRNVVETDDPQYILDHIKPFEFEGRKFISFDTETHPHYKNSHLVPASVCRRWVGKGKAAKPQDYPFSLQIFDGTTAFILYDSIENNFEDFKRLAPILEDASVEKIAHNTTRVNLVL